jgi:hypothetical protein
LYWHMAEPLLSAAAGLVKFIEARAFKCVSFRCICRKPKWTASSTVGWPPQHTCALAFELNVGQ